MRPLQLKLEGFGPFGGTEQVDFSVLSGVFLITGDTGAGKTTIFDGICYALFGETSGSARQVDSLRSQYAGAEQPTQVTLLFQQHEKTYEIRRSPRYERPRKSGKGMTGGASEGSPYAAGWNGSDGEGSGRTQGRGAPGTQL